MFSVPLRWVVSLGRVWVPATCLGASPGSRGEGVGSLRQKGKNSHVCVHVCVCAHACL